MSLTPFYAVSLLVCRDGSVACVNHRFQRSEKMLSTVLMSSHPRKKKKQAKENGRLIQIYVYPTQVF